MNVVIISYILGQVLKIEGALMLLPCFVSLLYKEPEGYNYLFVAVLCLILGFLLTLQKPKDFVFYLKEGCVATSLCWIAMSFFGSLPFILTGEIPHLTDALFETVSGFTTTGASVLSNVEALSYTSLFWRSLTNWIGGMGVLLFVLAVIPLNGGSHINLMRAESPGPSVGKLVPKLRYTARILYIIYIALTILQILFLLLGGMPLFDAVATSFSTGGTGGFGIKNDSIASYSPYIQWVITIFLILFSVNFNAYFFILFRQFKKAFTMEEVRWYFVIIISAVAIIYFNILETIGNAADALRHASFQVASIISTAGFSTADFDTWSQTSKTVLVFIMFTGACAGSTGGGIKISRIIILVKTIFKELRSYIHPKSVFKINMEGKPLEHEVVRSTNVYFITFMLIFATSIFILSFEGKDLTTNFTAVIATLNNIGPGLELVGPTKNFGHFSVLSKWTLIIDMLAGRLELFPLLILFHPAIWKDVVTQNLKQKKK